MPAGRGAGTLPPNRSVSKFACAWGAGAGGHGACLEGKVDCMIKLVASDMDGTLLDEGSQVPPETFDLIKRLDEVGIRFAVSSGRRLDTLREFLAPVDGCIDFVASNGAQVMVAGKLVDREVFSYMALKRLKKVVDAFDCLHMALFDRSRSYLLESPDHYELEADKDLRQATQVADVPDPDTSIVKASVYCDTPGNVMDMAYVLERELGDAFVFAPSGRSWIDVMQKGVSKATGLRQVLAHHGIRPDQVMAFGDSMNDYELLTSVGHPIAMGNGRYAVKQIAERVIGTNAEHAVQRELRRLADAAGQEEPPIPDLF